MLIKKTKKYYIINTALVLLLLIGMVFGQSNEIEKPTKHNISIGALDDRAGFSFIGYTYNLNQTEMDEYFIGAGTMIVGFTGSTGWKHFFTKSRLSLSSVLCGQYVMHMGFQGFLTTGSLTCEYNLTNKIQIKLGGMGVVMLTGDNSEDIGVLPFAGLNFRF